MGKGKTLEPELMATVLIEAAYTTDAKVCAKYGVAERTLRSYRQKLTVDPEFADLCRTKKAALDKEWAEELPGAMRAAARSIATISANILDDPLMRKNPFALEKLAGALKLCADVYYTGKVIDARLAEPNRPAGQVSDEGASSAESQYAH